MYTTSVLDAAIAFSMSAGDSVSAVVQHTSARASRPETSPVDFETANKEEGMAPKVLASAKAPTYVMRLRSVGNPDYGQYTPISEPAAVKGKTLKAMVQAAQEYIEEWNLGGGNWPETEIRTLDGQSVGFVSYNGKVWDRPWQSGGPKPVEVAL